MMVTASSPWLASPNLGIPLHISAGDERADADMERGDGYTSLEADLIMMGGGPTTEEGAPPPAPHPGSGLERAFAKASLQSRLTTQEDYVSEGTLREVYRVTMSLLQPGGLIAGLLTDMSVGFSVVIPQVVAALANADGLMAAVHAWVEGQSLASAWALCDGEVFEGELVRQGRPWDTEDIHGWARARTRRAQPCTRHAYHPLSFHSHLRCAACAS